MVQEATGVALPPLSASDEENLRSLGYVR